MLDAVNSNSDELAKLSQDKNKIEPSVHIERKLEGEFIESSENQTNIAIEKVVSSIEDKVAAHPEVKSSKVTIVFDPPWDKDMMSEEAQLELGFL